MREQNGESVHNTKIETRNAQLECKETARVPREEEDAEKEANPNSLMENSELNNAPAKKNAQGETEKSSLQPKGEEGEEEVIAEIAGDLLVDIFQGVFDKLGLEPPLDQESSAHEPASSKNLTSDLMEQSLLNTTVKKDQAKTERARKDAAPNEAPSADSTHQSTQDESQVDQITCGHPNGQELCAGQQVLNVEQDPSVASPGGKLENIASAIETAANTDKESGAMKQNDTLRSALDEELDTTAQPSPQAYDKDENTAPGENTVKEDCSKSETGLPEQKHRGRGRFHSLKRGQFIGPSATSANETNNKGSLHRSKAADAQNSLRRAKFAHSSKEDGLVGKEKISGSLKPANLGKSDARVRVSLIDTLRTVLCVTSDMAGSVQNTHVDLSTLQQSLQEALTDTSQDTIDTIEQSEATSRALKLARATDMAPHPTALDHSFSSLLITENASLQGQVTELTATVDQLRQELAAERAKTEELSKRTLAPAEEESAPSPPMSLFAAIASLFWKQPNPQFAAS